MQHDSHHTTFCANRHLFTVLYTTIKKNGNLLEDQYGCSKQPAIPNKTNLRHEWSSGEDRVFTMNDQRLPSPSPTCHRTRFYYPSQMSYFRNVYGCCCLDMEWYPPREKTGTLLSVARLFQGFSRYQRRFRATHAAPYRSAVGW